MSATGILPADQLQLRCGICGGEVSTLVFTIAAKLELIDRFDMAHAVCRERGAALKAQTKGTEQ